MSCDARVLTFTERAGSGLPTFFFLGTLALAAMASAGRRSAPLIAVRPPPAFGASIEDDFLNWRRVTAEGRWSRFCDPADSRTGTSIRPPLALVAGATT